MTACLEHTFKKFRRYIACNHEVYSSDNIYKYIAILVIRILFVMCLLFKTEAFIKLLDLGYNGAIKLLIKNSFLSMFSFQTVKMHLAYILCLFALGYLFKKKGQIIFYFVTNIIVSFLMMADLSYFRINNCLLGLKNILYPGTFNVTDRKLINFNKCDIIFIVDIIFAIAVISLILVVYLMKKYFNKKLVTANMEVALDIDLTSNDKSDDNKKNRKMISKLFTKIKNMFIKSINESKRSFIKFAVFMILPAIFISQSSINACTNECRFCEGYFTKPSYGADLVNSNGVVGYHYVEAYNLLYDIYHGTVVSDSQKQQISQWINENRENLPDNEYRGVLKGKNVIIIQLESFENFIINKKTNGKEITPFLNKLSKDSLYFSNFYEQNNAGNSIDCDFLVNTSLFPIGGNTITSIYYGQNTYANSLPRILEGEGYSTVTDHAETVSDFNWGETHKNSFGVQKINDVRDFTIDEGIGYGISDRSFYNQVYDKLQYQKQPYLCEMATLTSHGPFNIDQKYRELDLPQDVNKTYLGGYFESVHYADKQLENFFNRLEGSGELDNTILVILGDHTGVHKYYDDYVRKVNYEDGWYKVNDYKIPMFIYAKGLKPQEIKKPGGQVDILPTLLYMMGVDKEKYENTSMGSVLVNTNRESSIMRNGKILGEPKDDKERNHILSAYDTSDIIIRKNYFKVK